MTSWLDSRWLGNGARWCAVTTLVVTIAASAPVRAAAPASRAVPLVPASALTAHDGTATAPQTPLPVWRQIAFDLTRAAGVTAAVPAAQSARAADGGAVPLAILDYAYERRVPGEVTTDPLAAAAVPVADGRWRALAVTGLRAGTHRGESVAFLLDPARYLTNRTARLHSIEFDFDDGRGFRPVHWGERVPVRYAETGRKTIRMRALDATGTAVFGSFPFDVLHLGTPTPDDTLDVVASISYLGATASGKAYVSLAPGHTGIVDPAVLVEGFDIDNTMDWDELYQQLDAHGLVEAVRAAGMDIVVLDFTDATDYIQRNAFVLTELIAQIEAMIAPTARFPVVGASMGGLVTRYALAYLEAQATPTRVRTFISFDTPHRGANIPLGVQYWVQFFADLSADAAFLRDRLNAPAARQMLVYHFTTPPSGVPAADPLRAQLHAELAAMGNYPTLPRLVAIANGSGTGAGQGFAPAAQLVRYEYSSFFVDIIGNVWAVPVVGGATVFRGVVDYLIGSDRSTTVAVSGTEAYDNAPGGTRSTMADMDAVMAPFGDIVALHPAHCFIPTVSALDAATTDLFHDLAGAPMATPFDAVYFPAANQGHVEITSENAAWFLAELLPEPTGIGDETTAAPARLALLANVPNPFNPATRIEFETPRPGAVEITLHDVRGRLVATVWRGALGAGRHRVMWTGTTDAGARAAAGVYLCTLRSGGEQVSRRMVLVE